ncbi:MAG: glcD [Firmicutes bacterium]|nr:glcD [Bacillota bacterium]
MALQREIINQLRLIVGEGNIFTDVFDLEAYSFDSSMYTGLPDVVVLPESVQQVVGVVNLAGQYRVPLMARGAGTCLSGGAVPIHGGIVLGLTKMNKVLELDLDHERIVVETGTVNLAVQKLVKQHGYLFAPDPASMKASTIGGNIAENAGGMHCVKYGNIREHILGLEVVLANGEVILTGEMDREYASPDLTSLFCGSEGTLGIITKAMLRLTLVSEKIGTLLAVFENLDDAGNAVSQILANGLLPSSLEVMNEVITKALIKYMNVDLSPNGEVTLLVEVEGYAVELEAQMAIVRDSFIANHAITFRSAKDQAERAKLWEARQGINGIFGQLGSAQLVQDPSVPVDKIGEMMRETAKIGKKYGVIICQTCHAGDGNLQPAIMYDAKSEKQHKMAEQASDEILKIAIGLGGSVSGEHGIGIENCDLCLSSLIKQNWFSWKSLSEC